MTGKPSAASKGRRSLTHRRKRDIDGRRADSPPHRNLRPRRSRLLDDDFLITTEDDEEEDEEEVEEEEEERHEQPRRGRKKLRLLVKLPRDMPASSPESSYVDDDGGGGGGGGGDTRKPPKKRWYGGRGPNPSCSGSAHQEEAKANGGVRFGTSISGGPLAPARTTFPGRKALEHILDKLQKKDTYDAFAQPVDPEELPDYHDVIEHPMDFGTVRRKLERCAYRSFEQFEDDVFLICSNAMQYNAPDTIYFRQARAIKEMARKEFQNLRVSSLHLQCERQSAEKNRSSSIMDEPMKTLPCLTSPERAVSDISSGATLASSGGTSMMANTTVPPSALEVLVKIGGLTDGGSSLCETKPQKTDEIQEKQDSPVAEDNSFIVDENRRASYNVAQEQPLEGLDMIFGAFMEEERGLVPVGLDAEFCYAKSLAHFAGPLGSTAWKIVSEKIEHSLPAGVKFGPGWVGEFQPLPTSITSFRSHDQHQTSQLQYSGTLNDNARDDGSQVCESKPDKICITKLQYSDSQTDGRSVEEASEVYKSGHRNNIQLHLKSQINTGCHSKFPGVFMEQTIPEEKNPSSLETSSRKGTSSTGIWNPIPTAAQQKLKNNSLDLATACGGCKTPVQCGTLPSQKSNLSKANLRRPECPSEVDLPTQPELISVTRNSEQYELMRRVNTINARSSRQQQLESVQQQGTVAAADSNGLRKGNKEVKNVNCTGSSGIGMLHPLNFSTTCKPQGANLFPHVSGQASGDNPLIMMHQSDRVPKQQSTQHAESYSANYVRPAALQPAQKHLGSARAWISIGTPTDCRSVDCDSIKSLAVPARHSGSWRPHAPPFSIDENSSVRAMPQNFPQPLLSTSCDYSLLQDKHQDKPLVIFPQLVGFDLARFHGHSPLQGLVQHPQAKDRDILRPDLNFQPTGSPVHSSSGLRIDSQQPDLALQL